MSNVLNRGLDVGSTNVKLVNLRHVPFIQEQGMDTIPSKSACYPTKLIDGRILLQSIISLLVNILLLSFVQ